jgi:hypothetical protein
MLSTGGKASSLPTELRKNCIETSTIEEIETRNYEENARCYEISTQFEILNLKEPPPIKIKYDPKRIETIQNKFPKLWSEKTGKFKIPDIKLDLKIPEPEILVKSKEWRHPKEKYDLAQIQIDEYLREELIEPSTSRHASNIVIVPREEIPKPGMKKRVRVCFDGRELNQFLNSPQNKTPNIEVLKQQVAGAKVFTRLDIRNAFLTLPLHPDHRPLTAIRCKGRLYQFTRIPFGLVSSMAIFIETMTREFKALEDCVLTYVDDVIVFSKTIEEHYEHLERVLRRINEMGITLNLQKSEFVVDEMKFVGYIINQHGIKLNPEKCELVRLMHPPRCQKDVKKFLGATNYFSQHLPNYSTHTAILNELTKKTVPWKWTEVEQEAFDAIKTSLYEQIMIFHADPNAPLEILFTMTDDSYSAVIMWRDENESGYRPAAFVGKAFKDVEKRYSPIKREFTAVREVLKRYGYMLYGHELTVYLPSTWPELLSSEPTHTKRLQKANEQIHALNATVKSIPKNLEKIATYLSEFPPNEEY